MTENSNTDFKTFLKAFEIVSDRLSDVQEDLAFVRETLVQAESVKYGQIAGRVFGLPASCAVYRVSDRVALNQSSSELDLPFEHGRVDCLAGAALMFYVTCHDRADHPYRMGGPHWSKGLPQSQEFYQELEDRFKADNDGEFLTTKAMGILSNHQYMHQEEMEMHFREVVPDGWCVDLLNEDDDVFEVSLTTPSNEPVCFADFMKVVKTLFMARHFQSCWKMLKIYDCNPFALELLRLAELIEKVETDTDLNVIENEQRLDTAATLVKKLPTRTYMLKHPYQLWTEDKQNRFGV